jgi:hypothetical protein
MNGSGSVFSLWLPARRRVESMARRESVTLTN